jgi:hypothetical protein
MAPRKAKSPAPAQQDKTPADLELHRLWRVDVSRYTEHANLRFAAYRTGGPNAQMELKWGPSPRQQRTYMLGAPDLRDLHDWLTKVLGAEEPAA